MEDIKLSNRKFAIGRNLNGVETSVAVWADGNHEGTGRGFFIEFVCTPFGMRPFNPPTGEYFGGTYTLKQVRKLVPHLAP